MEKIIQEIKARLEKKSDTTRKQWWENYVKNDSIFIGVKMSDIRKIILDIYEKHDMFHFFENEKMNFSMMLFKEKISEYKLCAILFLQKFVNDAINPEIVVNHIEKVFDQNCVYDWNICDWLCVKVLTPIIKNHEKKEDPQDLPKKILSWIKSDNYWKQRASVVPFAHIKDKKNYLNHLLDNCEVLIKRNERFSKTTVGWMLRELYKQFPNDVLIFLENYKQHLIPEVIANALEKMDKDEKKKFKDLLYKK